MTYQHTMTKRTLYPEETVFIILSFEGPDDLSFGTGLLNTSCCLNWGGLDQLKLPYKSALQYVYLHIIDFNIQ